MHIKMYQHVRVLTRRYQKVCRQYIFTIFLCRNKPSLTEAEKAAEVKCYGRLTREKIDWHPSRILCIRFNVKQPYGDSSIVGVPAGYRYIVKSNSQTGCKS